MRVLVWPYAKQKREIMLYIGVKSLEAIDINGEEGYLLRFNNGNVETLLRSYVHKMMVDDD